MAYASAHEVQDRFLQPYHPSAGQHNAAKTFSHKHHDGPAFTTHTEFVQLNPTRMEDSTDRSASLAA